MTHMHCVPVSPHASHVGPRLTLSGPGTSSAGRAMSNGGEFELSPLQSWVGFLVLLHASTPDNRAGHRVLLEALAEDRSQVLESRLSWAPSLSCLSGTIFHLRFLVTSVRSLLPHETTYLWVLDFRALLC